MTWTTDEHGSWYLPAHSSSRSIKPTSRPIGQATTTTITSSVPVATEIQSSTTFTSFTPTTITSILPTSSSDNTINTSSSSQSGSFSASQSIPFPSGSAVPINGAGATAVCLGDGLDASSAGLIASILIPSVIGLIIWLIFAFLRPKFRQIYGVREWFTEKTLRPKPLSSSFFAFLHPPVPLVPKMPEDVSDAGRSALTDAELFPSDEQLTQRTLWVAFLIVLGWTILALAGALPLYLVSTPCLADLPSTQTRYGGSMSALQDLSLARLLKLIDTTDVSVQNLAVSFVRRADGDNSDPQNARIRIILLTVLTLVVALLPALYKIIKEFNLVAAYRQRWLSIHCRDGEMGWLSARDAPGFIGWGEKRLKDYILKIGLSSSLDKNGRGGSRSRNGRQRQATSDEYSFDEKDEAAQVNIQGLFSIGDTEYLAVLIDERDAILENLEMAEARYINSFRLSTPDPSIADFEPTIQPDPNRPLISRPRALSGSRRRKRSLNPALASSSLAPAGFVAPSMYYSLRNVRGVTGGRFTGSKDQLTGGSFTDAVNSQLVGSRFQEVNRDSTASGRLPLGSQLTVDESGRIVPVSSLPVPDPRIYGPNQTPVGSIDRNIGQQEHEPSDLAPLAEDEEWVDLRGETSKDSQSDYNGTPPATATRRPKHIPEASSSTKRETFPFRKKGPTDVDDVPPPHLRVQPRTPFVKPLDGVDFDHLGTIYSDITLWRTRLKAVNTEIADAQHAAYQEIADGARIKGWILTGKGLRFIPSIQLIEGRSKDDIRWDVLQNERTVLDSLMLWALVAVVVVALAAGLAAASGLALATAPNFNHHFPFLHGILNAGDLAAGLATMLAPSIAAALFIFVALSIVHWAARVKGSPSVSGTQLFTFRLSFILFASIALVWIITIGSLLFSVDSFTNADTPAQSVAEGSIYMSALCLSIILQLAIIVPGLLLLQPLRLWRVVRAERQAATPRQRFRALYPRSYNPVVALAASILAIIFASTFCLIFPLICPAVVVLLLLALIAHRFLIGYVYGRQSQNGGLLQLCMLRWFGTLLSLQPILLGLIFLSRGIWIEGGVLIGAGVAVVLGVLAYTSWKMRQPGPRSLAAITKDSLKTFASTARQPNPIVDEETTTSLVSSGAPGQTRPRGSMASVLEMMSLTLAVMPSPSPSRGPIPLQTETLDDLTATERAARIHPDAPPHLPPLPFTDHAEEMAGILYAPELIAPNPTIWLPNDSAGVARSEAVDLQKYHNLRVTLDVRTKDDVLH